jgi:hypothetical protein
MREGMELMKEEEASRLVTFKNILFWLSFLKWSHTISSLFLIVVPGAHFVVGILFGLATSAIVE